MSTPDPTSPSDAQLLAAYLAGSQAASATLVNRHIDTVYSAACRQVRDRHLAEDVTQAVFLILSKKARTLRPGTVLGAWLHWTVRYCAANSLRHESRRRRHETRAAKMVSAQATTTDEEIDQSPALALLDAAIAKLSSVEQKAVILRFFENKSHATVGAELGLSSEAVNKKIQRALVKLQRIFARMGYDSTPAVLAGDVLSRARHAAPAHLAGAISSAVSGAGVAASLAQPIARGAMRAMFWSNIKAVAAATLLFVGVATAVVATAQIVGSNQPPAQGGGANPPASPAALAATPVVYTIAGDSQVTVSVVDSDGGHPIAGATLATLAEQGVIAQGHMDNSAQTVGHADAAGQIRLLCDPAIRQAFLVTAPGKTPRVFAFWGCVPPTYKVAMSGVGPTLEGKIVDDAGRPVANAPLTMRLFDDLLAKPVWQREDIPVISYPLAATTDATGHFSVPAAEGQVDGVAVQQAGDWYNAAHFDMDVDAAMRNGTFIGHPLAKLAVLEPPPPAHQRAATMSIHLRVLDEQTNQVIDHVRVTAGGDPDGMGGNWYNLLPNSTLDLPGGDVNWAFYDRSLAYFLQVEADGYTTTRTPLVKSSQKEAQLELKLARATMSSLTVLTSTGAQAAGAQAYLATQQTRLKFPLGPARYDDAAAIAGAGEDGVIRFSPPAQPYVLVISHPDGWAILPGGGGQTVTLTPWTSFDVTASWDGEPASGAEALIFNSLSRDPKFQIRAEAKYVTDESGHVSVPMWPGTANISIYPPSGPDFSHTTHSVMATIKPAPGQHMDVSLGQGKTTLSGKAPQVAGYQPPDSVFIRRYGPATELPVDINQIPDADRGAAARTAANKAVEMNASDKYLITTRAPVGADGTFSVAGLNPGTSSLSVSVEPTNPPPPSPSDGGIVQTYQVLDYFFTIPTSQPATVDLGVLPAKAP